MISKTKTAWKTLHSERVHENPWYQISHDKVIRPDGKPGDYFVAKTKGASVYIVAVNVKEEICFVALHRYPVRKISLELPAGNSEGQTLLSAAKRELLEETGYAAGSWKKMATWHPVSAILNETGHIYLARNLKRVKRKVDWHEGICRVEFFPKEKIFKMIRSERIQDGQTLAGILFAAFELGWFEGKP